MSPPSPRRPPPRRPLGRRQVTIAIDPSIRASGFALFVGRELRACGLVRAESNQDGIEALHDPFVPGGVARGGLPSQILSAIPLTAQLGLVVVEWPQAYRGSRVDPNALLQVAGAAGWYSALAVRILEATCTGVRLATVLPRAWKGQVPKLICTERVLRALAPLEREVVARDLRDDPKSLQHNAIDAIGIGRHALAVLL
jgi:hypothetical protein